MADGGITLKMTVNNLPRVRQRFGPAVEAIITKGTFDVLGRTVATWPVDTGTSKNAWSTAFDRTPGLFSGIVFNPVHYTPYIELGTRFMPARPRLQSAFEQVQPSLLTAFRSLERML